MWDELKSFARRAFRRLIDAYWAPVGLWNRIVVVLGTFSLLPSIWWPHSWRYILFYLVLWTGIYWVNLSTAYHRGTSDAFRSMGGSREGFEMYLNTKLVALQDLRDVCMKYNISPEEVMPIIERGFGVRFVEVIDEDGDASD